MMIDGNRPEKQGIVMHSCSLTRRGLLNFFNLHLPDFTVQAFESFRAAGTLSALTTAELMLIDINGDEKAPFFGMDGVFWLQQIRENKPLVIITENVTEQLRIGLSSQPSISLIALKTPEMLLLEQLHQVMAGKQVISSLLSFQPVIPVTSNEFTVAELRVCELLRAGFSVTEIASRLNRSIKTVSAHKRKLMTKLRVDNEIALFSRVNNLNERMGALD